MFKGEHCRSDKCALGRCMGSGQSESASQTVKPATGEYIIDYQAVPLKDRAGKVTGAVEVVVDRTAIAIQQEQMRQVGAYQDREVTRLNRSLEQLAAGNLAVSYTPARGNTLTTEVHGRFEGIAKAFNHAVDSMAGIMGRVKGSILVLSNSAEELSVTARQLLGRSHEMEQGSGEVNRTTGEVSDRITSRQLPTRTSPAKKQPASSTWRSYTKSAPSPSRSTTRRVSVQICGAPCGAPRTASPGSPGRCRCGPR